GAIYVSNISDNRNVTITDTEFGGTEETDGNTATYGGAIYASETDVTITNTEFSKNEAVYGGAIYIAESSDLTSIELNDVTFEGNSAQNDPVNGNSSAIAKLAGSTLLINKDGVNVSANALLEFLSDDEYAAKLP
ncbi:MAG: hypothetical protein LBT05_12710, partial [Planctomycetaceae bacterium]|nr:hypothetical protein [Planctomycetaceae bacterium]